MKILFLGGNGNISWHCVQRALEQGNEVWVLNRAETRKTRRAVQSEVHQIISDLRDVESTKKELLGHEFDVVCDFICYNQNHAKSAIELFTGITRQYIFISSEAVYKRTARCFPFKETSEKYTENEICSYIQGKVSAENMFINAHEKDLFPVTIVRPGYTYDTIMPVSLGHNCFTAMKRIMDGFPMLMYGDGNNLCCPLHSSDFSNAFISLCGNTSAVGEDYHITAENLLTMNEMAEIVFDELKISEKNIIHIPFYQAINLTKLENREITKQNMMHNVFDNSKIKCIIPNWTQKYTFKIGLHKTLKWLFECEVRRRIDNNFNKYLDLLYNEYWRISI